MTIAYSFFVGLFVTVVATAVLWRFAHIVGAIDPPGPRKIHSTPIPRVGGIAIAISALTAILLWTPLRDGVIAFIGGAVVIVATGIWDDIRPLNYKWKVLGQAVGIAVSLSAGLPLERISIAGFDTVPAYLSYPIAFVFLFFVTNAFNLFDGLDGLAGGCLVVSIGAISGLALLAGESSIPTIGFALIGGVLGFLRYNSHPAVLFMGDAGSQFLGFTAGYLALLLVTDVNPALNIGLPFLILGLPLLDTLSVALRRILQKRSPFQGDRQHLHHRMLGIGLTHAQTVTVLYAIQISMVLTAFFSRYRDEMFVFTIFAVFGLLVFGSLYWIERLKNSQPAMVVASLRNPSQPHLLARMLKPLVSHGHLAAAVLLAVFIVFGAIVSKPATKDIAILSAAICAAIVLAAFLELRLRNFVFRLAAYSAAVVVCFLLIRGDASTSIWQNWHVNVYLAGLGLLVLISIAFNRTGDFRLSPQDLLMALLVVVVPNLEIDRQFNFPVAAFLLQISIVFYAIEFVLSTRSATKSAVPASAMIGLLIIAARGGF